MVFVGFSAELICILKVGDFKGPIPYYSVLLFAICPFCMCQPCR